MSRRAKGYAGAVLVALGLVCGVAAATSYEWAIGLTILALVFGGPGVGLLAEATDPRWLPNERTRRRPYDEVEWAALVAVGPARRYLRGRG